MSVSNLSRRRGTILDEIMAYRREQLPKTMREVPLEDLRALASLMPAPLDLYAALKRPGVSLIAECKKASPSRGLIAPRYDPVALARSYVRAGASAISVLTDARYFQGSLAHLRDVKEGLAEWGEGVGKKDPRRDAGIPVLRKDFIFHRYQVFEARAAGADALLLIAAVLSQGEMASLLGLARELGLQALVEVHTAAEIAQVLPLQPQVIGINNRDLQTFKVDLERTARLRSLIPPPAAVVSESGIRSPEDVARLAQLGVDGMLVGERLVRSRNVPATVRQLLAAGQPPGDA